MARIGARADAARDKAEANPERKARDRAKLKGKEDHRVRGKARENPSRNRVQGHSPAPVATARPAQAMHPVTSSSTCPAACRHRCSVQAAAVVRQYKQCGATACIDNIAT